MGQCANLGLALLLLPVARRSVIAEAFGLAWEQLLWAHIWVGYATLLLFVAHAVCWYKVYASLKIFPEDILEIPMYYPTHWLISTQVWTSQSRGRTAARLHMHSTTPCCSSRGASA